MSLHLTLPALLLAASLAAPLGASRAEAAPEPGAEVVVIYNSRVKESKDVAEHYASRRHVPAAQVWGFDLPESESMTRPDYLSRLESPVLKRLQESGLWTFGPPTNQLPNAKPGTPGFSTVQQTSIRYAVLCYGVPTKIEKDDALVEQGFDTAPAQMRRNEGAVDTQLAMLPAVNQHLPWAGMVRNPFYGLTNATPFTPINGLLMVTRLDGPSAAIAKGLVDKSLEAEKNGLWGRAYFDARGLGTNDEYRLGDDFIRGAATVARRFGFETDLDEKPEPWPAGFPASQIAIYSGWYDTTVEGPFAQPKVEFIPGAFAYHLYSFSAQTIRSSKNSWVGTLLERGATCTMGAVDEPYLDGTPDIFVFLGRLTFGGFSFGEAAYASQRSLSWQTTIIGDPLYRPFSRSLEALHHTLEQSGSKLLEWSHLLVINRNLAIGSKPAEMIQYIESFPISRQSAVLTEKCGDLFWAKGGMGDAIDSYEAALRRGPSPQQKIRLLLKAAEKRSVYGPDAKAYGHYQTLLKEFPDYPNALGIYQLMLPLAKRLNNADETARCAREILRLLPPASTKPAR